MFDDFLFLNLRKKILKEGGKKKLVTFAFHFVSFGNSKQFRRVETIHNLGGKGRILIEIIKYTDRI